MNIKVIHPFSLRLSSKDAVRDFAIGVHKLSQTEHDHWFMQGCLKEGRAVLMADNDEAKELSTLNKDELLKLKNSELEEILTTRGISFSPNMKKTELVDLLLAD